MLSKTLYIFVDCASKVSVPRLPKDVACHLDSTCTGISCCAYVELIHKNINIFLALEPCNNKVRFGIEKYQFTVSLMDFDFGTRRHFHIARVFEIE